MIFMLLIPTISYANADSIWVCCSNLFFSGEKITIEGEVNELLGDTQIGLRIVGPNGKIVNIAQLDVGDDKSFRTEITAGGRLMEEAGQGEYTVFATYGGQQMAPTIFDFAFDWTTANQQNGNTITLSVPNSIVYYNDRVMIKGSVHPLYPVTPQVKISVTNPDNKVVFSQSVWIDEQTGIFEKNLETNLGSLITGTYTVTAKYKDSEITKSFEFKAEQKPTDFTSGQSNLKFPVIKTNNVYYSDGDDIIISGSIANYDVGFPVQMQILDSKGDMVDVMQSQALSDGTIHVSFKAGGPKWTINGQYEIRAQYDNHVFSTYFDYQKNAESIGNVSSDTMSMQEENKILQQQVSSLRLQVQTLENKIDNLNQIIQEQVKVIYQWVVTR
jgi:hypothetical protein